MIKKVKVEIYMERLYCDECGSEMKQGDTVLMTYPPQYSYICPQCNKTTTDIKSYPYITYKETKDEC